MLDARKQLQIVSLLVVAEDIHGSVAGFRTKGMVGLSARQEQRL
jgi:hypothetical protein